MKKMTVALLVFLIAGTTVAQIQLPQPSPTATLKQKVGLTDVEIVYSRPGVKDRKIFGELVPYGELWRTGANQATKISFSDDVKIHGQELKAGTYALFTIPGKDEWTVIFNKNANQGGTGNYKETEDALRIKVEPEAHGHIHETFTINLDEVRDNSAEITLTWENISIAIPLEVDIDDRIMASIDRTLNPQPNEYYQAATYYHQSGRDLDQALIWINKALDHFEKEGMNYYWVYREKALILGDMGKRKDAVEAAKIAKEKASQAGNQQYVQMNQRSIEEWSK